MSRRITRRRFGARLAAGVGAATAPVFTVNGAARPRLVVIGGGPAGITVARHVARSGAIDVTLVEPKERYTTCFISNLHLGGLRSFESITHRYDALAALPGLELMRARADALDTAGRTVRLAGGAVLPYDRLVVAPGIDFRHDAIEGYDAAAARVMPHAWQAGEQTRLLKAAIDSVPDGGLFIIAPPVHPFRCPPAPYERACMAALSFKRRKINARILIIDAKNSHSKQDLFQQAWRRFYPGVVEWLPADMTDGGVKAVSPSSMEVITTDERFKADAINVIPPQTAGAIALDAGLADDSGWCPVRPDTLASTLAPHVHLVGDAIIPGDMPKSAFAASSQGAVCAEAILAELAARPRAPAHFHSTCWSLLSPDNAVKIGARYEAGDATFRQHDGFQSTVEETDVLRAANAREAERWYAGIVEDVFG